MSYRISLFLLAMFFVSLFFTSAPPAFASADWLWESMLKGGLATIGATAYQLTSPESPKTPALIVADAIQVSLSLLGIIFLTLIVYAGFRWLTSRGDDTIIGGAKNLLIHAVIGLLIVLAAYSITYFVINGVLTAVYSGDI